MLQPVRMGLSFSVCRLSSNIMSGLSRCCSILYSMLLEATSTLCSVLSICRTVPSRVFVALLKASSLITSRISENNMLYTVAKMAATMTATHRLRRVDNERRI